MFSNSVGDFIGFQKKEPIYACFINAFFDNDKDFINAASYSLVHDTIEPILQLRAKKNICQLTFRNRYLVQSYLRRNINSEYKNYYSGYFKKSEIDCCYEDFYISIGVIIIGRILDDFIDWAFNNGLLDSIYPTEDCVA